MRLRTIAVLLCAAALSAQEKIDPARYQSLVRYLDPQPGEVSFVCSVTPIRPALNFSLRFEAGFAVRVPLQQFTGSGHRWNMIVEVVSRDGGAPEYLGRLLPLPEIPATHKVAEFAGGYLLGEGRYRARWVMLDERRRVCRAQWTIDVKPSAAERRLRTPLPPGSVSELTWGNLFPARQASDDAGRTRNLTLLLDVAPMSLRRQRLRASDCLLLVALASSILESVPAQRVRLVAFSLDQQREIFRRDSLAPGDLEKLEEALEGVELATVDYRVLQDPAGYRNLLARLVEQEVSATPATDTVVFLGPIVHYLENVPANLSRRSAGPLPRFYYFQYRPLLRRPIAFLPDSINRLVGRLKGKSFTIRTPADFQKAIEHLEK